MGSFASCIQELKNYEDLAMHFPLSLDENLFPKEIQSLLNEPHQYNSCRSELIHINLAVERVVALIEKDEKLKMERSVQLKRRLATKQLTLCGTKRRKME